MKRIFEIFTYVVVLCIGVGTLYIHAADYLRERKLNVHPGDHLSDLPRYSWHSHDRTLVLGLRAGCIYCANSGPFYKQLISLSAQHETNASVLAVFPDDEITARKDMEMLGLNSSMVSGVQPATLKITGTPTLLLVDERGVVTEVWVGQLSQNKEDAVIRTLISSN